MSCFILDFFFEFHLKHFAIGCSFYSVNGPFILFHYPVMGEETLLHLAKLLIFQVESALVAQQRCESVSEGKTNLLKGSSDNDNERRGCREGEGSWGETGNDNAKH